MSARDHIQSLDDGGELLSIQRGIAVMMLIVRGGVEKITQQDDHWYVFDSNGECNDDRHADTLLELVRKLGAAKAGGDDEILRDQST